MPADSPRRADRPAAVALAYALIAVVMTWPLARYLGTRLAADVGDPAFNSWVLAWTAGQILAALSGDFGALASYWHGNIFTPEPLTLAYSEHMTRAGIAGAADLRRHGKYPRRIQHVVHRDVRDLGPRDVLLRPRSHATSLPPRSWPASHSRTRRTGSGSFRTCRCCPVIGCRSCCLAFIDSSSGPRGLPPASGNRHAAGSSARERHAATRRRLRRARAPEPLVRLLPAVLHPLRRGLCGL